MNLSKRRITYVSTLVVTFLLRASLVSGQIIDHQQKISALQGNLGGITEQMGRAVANIGDLDGNGVTDIAVGDRSGIVWVLFLEADGTVVSKQAIENAEASEWGYAITHLGDLNGDNSPEIAVGAPGDYLGGERGAVWILSLNSDGTVKKKREIAGAAFESGGIGVSLTSIGDLDADGVQDLVVGSINPTNLGEVLILFLNANATVKSFERFSFDENPTGGETGYQAFGASLANLGDLDGDGVNDIAVGKPLDNDGSPAGNYFSARGSVFIVFLNTDGSVKAHQKISDTEGNFAGEFRDFDKFGQSITALGDLNEDGVTDIAVGAVGGDIIPRNTVWILSLNADGTVLSFTEIDENTPALNGLIGGDRFGAALTNLGDMNGNGIEDLMVGAPEDDDGGENRGAIWTLFLEVTRVGAFTLIDATTDLPIPTYDPLRTGAVLNLDELPTYLNIRAHAAGTVESVQFDYDGEINFRTESSAPYALFGDLNGDFANGELQEGLHTLTATPYAEDSAMGEAGLQRTISFEVTQSPTEALASRSSVADKKSMVASSTHNEFPSETMLESNYPNPFNSTTAIRYSLTKAGDVKLIILDMLGREVRTVVNGNRSAGKYEVFFDAGSLPSGMYLYRLETPGRNLTRKMLLIQ